MCFVKEEGDPKKEDLPASHRYMKILGSVHVELVELLTEIPKGGWCATCKRERHGGRFVSTRLQYMPFGIDRAINTFKWLLDIALEFISDCAAIYIEDIIYSTYWRSTCSTSSESWRRQAVLMGNSKSVRSPESYSMILWCNTNLYSWNWEVWLARDKLYGVL